MPAAAYTRDDYDIQPLMLYYEVTQACDLVCRHCRASAQACALPDELTSDLSRQLIDQAATFPRPPVLVLTGGDPLKQPRPVRSDSPRAGGRPAGCLNPVGNSPRDAPGT